MLIMRILLILYIVINTSTSKGQNCEIFEDIIKTESVVGTELLYTAFLLKNDTLFYIIWDAYDTFPQSIDTIPLHHKKNIIPFNSTKEVKITIKKKKIIIHKMGKTTSRYKKRRNPLYKRYKYFKELDKIFMCK